MSFSVFYAVRFSPAPELGEWLNVAVVGEGISEHKAGLVLTDSMDRIQAAFGLEAAERVAAIGKDLANLVAAMVNAHDRGEETQPIPTAMRDRALSLSFSEQIAVFEGTFEDALASIAERYLTNLESEETLADQPELRISGRQASIPQQDSELGRLAHRLARFSKEIFPAAVVKTIEQGQKAIDSIVHGPEVKTVLVVGGAGHLGSALVPGLLESGKRVRLYDHSANGPAVVEISKTTDRLREAAGALGNRIGVPGLTDIKNADLESAMAGVDVVICIPEGDSSAPTAIAESMAIARAAKTRGVKRLIFAGNCHSSTEAGAALESALHALSDDRFDLTLLRLGELYGHAKDAQWFGDMHDASGELKSHPTVNVLTAHAILSGKVTAADSEPRAFLHVEDAVAAILAVLNAPSDVVRGQIYNVGSDDQIHTFAQVAELIKQQAPDIELLIALGKTGSQPSRVKFTKISHDLGFAPTRTLEEAISQLISAIRDGTVGNYLANRPREIEPPPVMAPTPDAAELRDRLRKAKPKKEQQASTDENIRQL